MTARWDIAVVLSVAFGVRLIWATLVPPFLAPDEFAHFSYVAHLIENGRIPNESEPDKRYPPVTSEANALCVATFCTDLSTLGWAPGWPTRRQALPIEHDYTPARELILPVAQRKTSGNGAGSDYPPLYYLYGAAFYGMQYSAPVVDRLVAVRAATAFLSALSAVFAYLFAFELKRDRAWGRCLGLCVALMPMHAFIGASVNNDAAFFTSTAALCWLTARACLVPAITLQLAAWLGIACGIALLSKPTTVPVVLLTMFIFAVRLLRDVRESRQFFRRALQLTGVFSAGFLLTEGPWLLFRLLRSASARPSGASGPPGFVNVLLGNVPYSLAAYVHDLQTRGSVYYYWLFIQSYWGQFGWLEVDLSAYVLDLIWWSLAIGLTGWSIRLVREKDERLANIVVMVAAVSNVAFLFLAADYANSFSYRGSTYGMQGRYFFGTLIPLLYMLVAGFSLWRRSVGLVLRLAPAAMLMLQGNSLLQIVRRYYAIGLP